VGEAHAYIGISNAILPQSRREYPFWVVEATGRREAGSNESACGYAVNALG
jgi:hypothetical protein